MARQIVVIGGGIIGSSTAYYLSRHPNLGQATIRVLEGSYIAAGSSGKGGGFLAADWHGPDTASLGTLSFRLHEELANEHGGVERWGYRKLHTLGITGDARSSSKKKTKTVPDAEWIAECSGISRLGDLSSTAQVHPFLLTNVLIEEAKKSGKVEVVIGSADGIELDETSGAVQSVSATTPEGEKLSFEATDVVFAAGPWTGKLAKKLLGSKAGAAADIIPSNRSTSIVIKTPIPATPHALFCEVVLPDGGHAQPEIYPRPDGTLYVCGAGMHDKFPLPERAADVTYSEEGVERLIERTRAVVNSAWIEEPLKAKKGDSRFIRQACYRPDSDKTGLPVVGKIGPGLWVASGHQVWGILHGPGTGKVMSELILDGKATSADVSSLTP